MLFFFIFWFIVGTLADGDINEEKPIISVVLIEDVVKSAATTPLPSALYPRQIPLPECSGLVSAVSSSMADTFRKAGEAANSSISNAVSSASVAAINAQLSISSVLASASGASVSAAALLASASSNAAAVQLSADQRASAIQASADLLASSAQVSADQRASAIQISADQQASAALVSATGAALSISSSLLAQLSQATNLAQASAVAVGAAATSQLSLASQAVTTTRISSIPIANAIVGIIVSSIGSASLTALIFWMMLRRTKKRVIPQPWETEQRPYEYEPDEKPRLEYEAESSKKHKYISTTGSIPLRLDIEGEEQVIEVRQDTNKLAGKRSSSIGAAL